MKEIIENFKNNWLNIVEKAFQENDKSTIKKLIDVYNNVFENDGYILDRNTAVKELGAEYLIQLFKNNANSIINDMLKYPHSYNSRIYKDVISSVWINNLK